MISFIIFSLEHESFVGRDVRKKLWNALHPKMSRAALDGSLPQPARVGSGSFRNLGSGGWVGSGRVGSGQEVFKLARIRSGHPYPARPDLTREG